MLNRVPTILRVREKIRPVLYVRFVGHNDILLYLLLIVLEILVLATTYSDTRAIP